MNNDIPSVDQTLQALKHYRQIGAISDDQVSQALGNSQKHPVDPTNHINIQRILYYIGAVVIFLGIAIYIAQYWSDMSQLARCLVSLVPAIAAYSLGYFFHSRKTTKDISQALFTLAIILFPFGLSTTLDVMGISLHTSQGISINAALLFVLFFTSSYVLRSELFIPFAVAAGSTLFLSVTDTFTNGLNPFKDFQLYQFMIMGVSYVCFGYYLFGKLKSNIPRWLDFFGLWFMLVPAFILQGWQGSGNVNLFWSAFFPGWVAIVYYLSIKLQNKVYLFLATLFTFAEIIKITYEHFANTVGLPLALIIAGCAMIACGYFSLVLGKKFRKQQVVTA